MFLDSGAMLSFGVFDYLWSRYSKDVDTARSIVSRHLSPAQRAWLITQDLHEEVLEAFVRYNIPTFSELKAFRVKTLTPYAASALLDYYVCDAETAAVLGPMLADDVRVLYMMRSDPSVFGDTEVLAGMNAVYAPLSTRSLVGRVDIRSSFIQSARDLIETRPHLILDVAKNRDTRIQITVAESRYVSDAAVLEQVIGCAASAFNTKCAELVDVPVLAALADNPVVPVQVRRVARRGVVTLSDLARGPVGDATVSSDFSAIGGEHLMRVCERTVGTNSVMDPAPRHDWDILVLAKNPFLPRDMVKSMLRRLGDDGVRRHLGAERVYDAHILLKNRLGGPEDTLYIEDLAPHLEPATPLRYAETPGDFVSELRLDASVESEFVGHCGSPKDASELELILGKNPHTWVSFIQALDVVSPETTIRKVATTSVRLANAN
jgi:hypothetical protein